MSVSRVVPCVNGVLVRPLRTAENVWERVDVLNGVFESLYLGQGLSSPAVVRRQVITELVQGFSQTPHPHLLPLAGLHAPFPRHLWLARSLRRGSGSLCAAERQMADLLVSGWAAQLRRRAHGIRLGLRGGGMMRVVIRSQGLPVGHDVDNGRIQVHLSYQHPRTASSSTVASRLEDKLQSTSGFYPDLRRFMGSQVERKQKFKEKSKWQNAAVGGRCSLSRGCEDGWMGE